MKRKNFAGRMQQKRIDTLYRLGQKYDFNPELMIKSYTSKVRELPYHIQNLVAKIQSKN